MVRVLLVDDFESFRRFVASAIGTRPELQIVGEASDGLEAVKKAEELQPDLILLDIGLPMLNGIEAARRIRKCCPQSKILFISANSSLDVVQGALATGAAGYLVKSNAGRELLPAIDAVLRGEQFLGSRIAVQDVMTSADLRSADDFFRSKGLASPVPFVPRKSESGSRHEVYFYSKEESLLNVAAQFIGAALQAGNAAVALVTSSRRESLFDRLRTRGLDVDAACAQGRFISLDAADALSTVMVKDLPDSPRFLELLGNLVVTAAKATGKDRAWVAVFGECLDLLSAQGYVDAAIQIEKLAHQFAKTHNVHFLCGYSLTNFLDEQRRDTFERICEEHSAVYCG